MRFLVHRSTRPLGAAVLGFAMMLGLAAAEARELPARGGPVTVAPIAERLIESVVNISTSQFVKGSRGVPLPQMKKGSPFFAFSSMIDTARFVSDGSTSSPRKPGEPGPSRVKLIFPPEPFIASFMVSVGFATT